MCFLEILENPPEPSKGYQPPVKGYQQAIRAAPAPDKGYPYPVATPPDNVDASLYPPIGRSGAAANIPLPDVVYDDENEVDYDDYGPAYYSPEDYNTQYNNGQGSPLSNKPYISPFNPFSQEQARGKKYHLQTVLQVAANCILGDAFGKPKLCFILDRVIHLFIIH